MKVAVVSPYSLDVPGGVQDQVIEISQRLGGHGIESWVVGPGRIGPPGARMLGPSVTIPANGSRAPLGLHPAIVGRARKAVEGADVVHLHEPLIPLVGWALVRSAGIPTVGTFHADPSQLVRGVYRRLGPLARWIVSNLSKVTAVSEVAASAVRPFRDDVVIVPNALATKDYQAEATKDPRRLAFLGRDDPRKGLDVLLAAWPVIRLAVPDAELDVIGARRAQAIPGVRFHGRLEGAEKRSILASAAVFVAPNLGGESFGITLLEGMAAGCAVVASDLPAFQSVGGQAVTYFRTGSASALGRAVSRLLLDGAARAEAARRSERRSQQFDWTTVLPAYIQTYESAVLSD